MLLQYIYLEDFKIESDIAEDLFKLCDEYMIKEVKEDCEDILMKDIRVENVLHLVQLSEKYEARELRKACLDFIVQNLKEVLKTQNFREQLETDTLIELIEMKADILAQEKVEELERQKEEENNSDSD